MNVLFRRLVVALSVTLVLTSTAGLRAADESSWVVVPSALTLTGNFARAQLLVARAASEQAIDDRTEDLTSVAKYASSNPAVAAVSEAGLVTAVTDGQAQITVSHGGTVRATTVTVAGVVAQPAINFTQHIRPILNKASCATAACHAAQHGKGGFKLSVFGSETDTDHRAMVRDSVLRRIDYIRPENSLVVQKPAMLVPHGGGRRVDPGSVDYQVLIAWVKAGCPGPQAKDPEIARLTVYPTRRVGQPGMKQQLRVEAEYTDGQRRDVTASARFDSMDDGVLTVARDGLVTTVGKGQAPVMVRFEGQAAIALFVVPYAANVELKDWTNHNFVDELASAKFRELGIEPSPVCDDATFVRRAFLDAVGTIPTTEEVDAFLASADPNKRLLLVDRLLGLSGDPAKDTYNDAYSAYWSLKWSDLIRNSSRELGDQGMWALHNWVRAAFRENRPFDQVVRELITAKGSIYSSGPANYFRLNGNPPALTEATLQTFLGIRMECAKCHHHPFEKYSQDDYYSFASFFARVGQKNSEEFGLFGRETVIIVRDSGEVTHPRTGRKMEPKPLDALTPLDHPLDRRIPLAQWLTSGENPLFARSVANRYMQYLMGRGLVEPVDDMRGTNPPSNPPLLDALARHLVDNKYNLKQLMRIIMTSRLYQLDSQPTPSNAADYRFYSHFNVKRLTAEPLADAIDRVTGVQTKYKSLPLGTRAIELPDAEYPDYFLNTFAKPRRASVCECERSPDANLSQALHTLNGDTLANKIGDKNGRVAKLITAGKSHGEIVAELYMATLSRKPSDAELSSSIQFLDEYSSRDEYYQDLLWALVNSKHFLFVH